MFLISDLGQAPIFESWETLCTNSEMGDFVPVSWEVDLPWQ
jgi:hypothetical protein